MDQLEPFTDLFLDRSRAHDPEGRGLAPIDSLSLDEVYEIQRRVIAARAANGEQVIGYKVGCTSPAIRQQFSLAEPICGRLMSPHVHHGDATLDWHAYHGPAVEPEFVLVLGKDVTDEVGDARSLADAIDFVSPGIELHHYFFDFGKPTTQELVASNGLHAGLIVGDRKLKPRALELDLEGVGLFLNDALVASGVGAEIMGGPLVSLRWLANHLLRRGDALRAGQYVIPGSPVGLYRVEAGDRVSARFTRLGQVEAWFR